MWDKYLPSLEFALGTNLTASTTFINDIVPMPLLRIGLLQLSLVRIEVIKQLGCPAFANATGPLSREAWACQKNSHML